MYAAAIPFHFLPAAEGQPQMNLISSLPCDEERWQVPKTELAFVAARRKSLQLSHSTTSRVLTGTYFTQTF